MPTVDNNDSDSITLSTLLPASAEQVWQAWTNPDWVLQWFGSDPAGKGLKAALDVRQGGKFEITFRDSSQTEHTCSGVYTEVHQPRLLSFTWTWKSEPGVTSLVTVSLTPDAKGTHTRMDFQHAHVGTASSHNYHEGWESTFVKLHRLLQANQP